MPYDWVGTIPAEALPRQLRPASGLIVNANNRLVGDAYPFLLTSDWDPALRAQRIEDLLGGARDLDADRFAAVQLDVTSPLAMEFLPYPAERGRRRRACGYAGRARQLGPAHATRSS